MYNYIYEESFKRAKHKIWLMSDLQQSDPEYAERCLKVSIDDYHRLDPISI